MSQSPKLGLVQNIPSSERPFSVYVPGLAGIPSRETYQGRLVVDRGAVRGDSNLYLRNVLYRLFQDPAKKQKFQERLAKLFDGLEIFADDFNENRHEHIPVEYSRGAVRRPLDMVGTGTLQAIQILSYASFYQPVLLLLDEPDAHLHPDNQRKLVEALSLLSQEENVQIILATHSRHLLQAVGDLEDVASFHLRSGALVGTDPALSELLVDLGAVDQYDNLSLRDKAWLILGEDKHAESDINHPLRIMLSAAGLKAEEFIVMSFQGCTEIRSVALLATFVAAHHPHVRILVHRDRDFLTDVEIQDHVMPQFANLANVTVFTTDGADLESAFLDPLHIGEICGMGAKVAENIINHLAVEKHNLIVTRFNEKRSALHKQYGRRAGPLARTEDLRSSEIPLPPDQRVGKDMTIWLIRRLFELKYIAGNDTILRGSASLPVDNLRRLIHR